MSTYTGLPGIPSPRHLSNCCFFSLLTLLTLSTPHGVTVNFMHQLDWCSESWENVISGCVNKDVSKKIRISLSRLSKKDMPSPMWVGIMWSVEALNRRKKAEEGQIPFLSSRTGMAIFSSTQAPTFLVLEPLDYRAYINGPSSSQPFGPALHYTTSFLVLQLPDSRWWEFSAFITTGDNSCTKCPFSWLLCRGLSNEWLHPIPQTPRPHSFNRYSPNANHLLATVLGFRDDTRN